MFYHTAGDSLYTRTKIYRPRPFCRQIQALQLLNQFSRNGPGIGRLARKVLYSSVKIKTTDNIPWRSKIELELSSDFFKKNRGGGGRDSGSEFAKYPGGS